MGLHIYVYVLVFINYVLYIISILVFCCILDLSRSIKIVMAPNTPKKLEVTPLCPLGPQTEADLAVWEEHAAIEQARFVVADNLKSPILQWVDLPPGLFPKPDRPPEWASIEKGEITVSPDKKLPGIFVMGGCEFAEGQLLPFTNSDESVIGLGPHEVAHYKLSGPIGGLSGPFSTTYATLVNRSVIGQSWHEVAVVDVDSYVAEWCKAKPAVTVLGLGLWDIVMGNVAWTPQCATPGLFGAYYTSHLRMFIDRAREYSRKIDSDFMAWFCDHTFVCLQVPNWFAMTPELEGEGTIDTATWERFRARCFRDMYPLQTTLWKDYRALVYHPNVPARMLKTQGYNYMLGPKYSRLYVAQVLAVVAKIVCRRARCRVPNDFQAMREHLLGGKAQDCGRYWAWFLPEGVSFEDAYLRGHC
ncbi:unnamed protein product [Meganyctiphanes norvegica]|uniref:Uncharacterized protein n=1 Tax=Meganyctiphanes norvegica TaxID=48144 RepID=A0AAV2Q4Z4_MEGNR